MFLGFWQSLLLACVATEFCRSDVVLELMLSQKCVASQVAPWSAPPWADSQLPATQSRHALADADQPPTWDVRQLSSIGHIAAAEEDDVEEVPASKDGTGTPTERSTEKNQQVAAKNAFIELVCCACTDFDSVYNSCVALFSST